MDTPDRKQIDSTVSKIEESPFSNFANSLSPINASQPTHISQAFSSLSFASPPSVFTSPHVSLQKESRFLRRHQVSELLRIQLSSDEGNKVKQMLGSDHKPQDCTNERARSERPSNGDVSVEPLCDSSKDVTEMSRVLEYDTRNPAPKIANSSYINENCEPGISAALVPYTEEPPISSFGTKLNCQDTKHDNDEAASDWQSLISCSADLFAFDSPNNATILKGSFQNSEQESNVFTSLLSRFPPDHANDLPCSSYMGSVMYDEASQNIDQSALPTETNELEQTDELPQNKAISSANGHATGNTAEKSRNKSIYNLHRGLRRRCLDFEVPRDKKSIDSVVLSSSLLSLNEEKSADGKQPITPVRDSSRCGLPGIGLHLNALAASSNDCRIPNQETFPTSQEGLLKLSASILSEKDVNHAESGLQLMEDASQVSVYAATEELNSNSPKKKRRKLENSAEAEGCKRCNCKKSKCLKLYCECFAAGVYCVEPCSCQDCFNKPIHEETVLATRKQIESRNPLAFAPKVIRTLDSSHELREDSSRTPASARHKRGCNCKKSNCLKKYCECYQGGVGCSVSCRCEGCKNAFGRKDGPTLLGMEIEIEEDGAPAKHITDKSSEMPASYSKDEDLSSELTLPQTPLKLFRPSIPVPTSSKGKPPRSSITAMTSSSYLNPVDGPGRSTFLRSQPKVDKFHGALGEELPTVLQSSSPPSSVKTLSPNSKRISPPHHENGPSPELRSSRKLILQSIPSFPSLTPRR